MTFREAMKQIGESWKNEIKTQSPAHICKQALKTLYLFPVLLLVMLYVRVRGLVVIAYRYARHYYFVVLTDLEFGSGTYAKEHKKLLQKKGAGTPQTHPY